MSPGGSAAGSLVSLTLKGQPVGESEDRKHALHMRRGSAEQEQAAFSLRLLLALLAARLMDPHGVLAMRDHGLGGWEELLDPPLIALGDPAVRSLRGRKLAGP